MTENKVSKVTKMNISRGEKAEVCFDLEKVEDLTVYDEFGEEIRFGDLYAETKTVIVFTRHLLCHSCKEYIDDLARVPPESFTSQRTKIIIICPAPYRFIREFRRETLCAHPIYADPDRVIYAGLGFRSMVRGESASKTSSPHIKSNWFLGVLQTSWRAMWYQANLGDTRQHGGCIIAGPGNQLHFSHVDGNMFDHVPINDILKEIGAKAVSFPGDRRVETV